jgi:transposase-like protein
VRQPSALYKRHRSPGEIISHAVWLYYRFLLSYRDVEELLAERGVAVSYESVRRWCRKFGPTFADGLRRRCCETAKRLACRLMDRGAMMVLCSSYSPCSSRRSALPAAGGGT